MALALLWWSRADVIQAVGQMKWVREEAQRHLNSSPADNQPQLA